MSLPPLLKKTYVLPMEGGLGAQILTKITGEYIRDSGIEVIYDMEYFNQPPTVGTPQTGVSIWEYGLDYYNIARDEFTGLTARAQWALKSLKWLTRKRLSDRYLFDGRPKRMSLLREALSRQDYGYLFPIHERTQQQIHALTGGDRSFGVAHLRRGDYLNVASHIIGDANVIALLRQRATLPATIFVISDGTPDAAQWRQGLPNTQIHFFKSDDIYLCHGLMRTAALLVTANSQFSYTAAILQTDLSAETFVPANWLAPGNAVNSYMHLKPGWNSYY